ncbi:hypothetical protein BSKO_06063 [Bryopsis sp. KO-2023]|nr:hypothetical protein BSKO_06063 [Bryopsis sp. KO-2023]
MQEEDLEKEIKVLVVGNGGVGKTSLIRRFCKGIFTDEYKKTIGVDFLERTLHNKSLEEDFKMMVWDTAGQEEFDSITRTYFRGAGAAVLVYSTTDRAAFDAIPRWKARVEAECGDIAMAIVQNKVDLIDQAAMSNEEAEDMARKLGLRVYRSCVKESLNVTEVFSYLTDLYTSKSREALAALPPPRIAEVAPKPKAGQRSSSSTEDDSVKAQTVDLTPTKRRTGGKKKFSERFCALG